MTQRFTLAARARADLAEICRHVGDVAGPLTAERVWVSFNSAFQLLSRQPNAGHRREDLSEDTLVRFWPVHSWLVAYVSDTTGIEIVAIVHGARRPEHLFEPLAEFYPLAAEV